MSLVPIDDLTEIATSIGYTTLYEESGLDAFLPAPELITSIGWVHGLYYVSLFKSSTQALAQFSFLYEDDPFGFWTCFDNSFALDERDIASIATVRSSFRPFPAPLHVLFMIFILFIRLFIFSSIL